MQTEVVVLLSSHRSGPMRGVCLWFSVSSIHQSTLSTSPESEPTHWQHAAVMLGREIVFEKGDLVGVEISITPALGGGADVRQKSISIALFDGTKGFEEK